MSRLRSMGLFVGLSLSLFLLLGWGVLAQGPLYPRVIDRFGVDVAANYGKVTDYDVASLHIGWYADWNTAMYPRRPGLVQFAQTLRVHPGKIYPPLSQLGPIVDANPGGLWMIGNEPECVKQDDCTPEEYADVYNQAYTFIKGRDPTAQIAIGGIVQPTPLRLKWLDRLLEYYKATYGVDMPVDVWNIHPNILPEDSTGRSCGIPKGVTADPNHLAMTYTLGLNDNFTIFQDHIVNFRTWMRDHGEQNKPLIISEYGVLVGPQFGFPPERVNTFMNATFDYMLNTRDVNLGYPADENRLVQRWLWCSLNDRLYDEATKEGYNGALFYAQQWMEGMRYPGAITPMGTNFGRYTQSLLDSRLVNVTFQQGSAGYAGWEDTHLNWQSPDSNYGQEPQVYVGGSNKYAGAVRFGVGWIPADATVMTATLQLYALKDGSGLTVDAFAISRTVSIDQATWKLAQADNPWGQPGCNNTATDRRGVPESSVALTGGWKWYSFDLTSLVQEWVKGTVPNNGVLLRARPAASETQARFASAQYGTAGQRPKLVVTYRTAQCSPPASPTGPSPAVGAAEVPADTDLDWADVPGAVSYDVYLGTTAEPQYVGTTTSSAFALPPLTPTVHYYWRVMANSCDQTKGPVWEFTTVCTGLPEAPSGPTPQDGATGVRATADLDWLNTMCATSYEVFFGTLEDPPYYTTTTASQLVLPTMKYLTKYYWKVKAKNNVGDELGAVWSFTTMVNSPPWVGTTAPSAGNAKVGVTKYFTTTWSDANGYADLKWNMFIIGSNINMSDTVYVCYDQPGNKLVLRNNDGTKWWGGFAPGSAHLIENKQAVLDCSKTTVRKLGNKITVRWAIRFKSTYTGTKKLYLKATDLAKNKTSWKKKGTVSISQ